MKIFEDYIQQRSATIKRNWKKYLEGRDEECLHQMRVEIKKLTALLHFINDGDGGFDLHKHNKLPHHLLEISGELRDHHNFNLLAEKFHFKVPSIQLQLEQFESQQALQKLQVYYRKHHTGLSQLKKEVDKYLRHLTSGQLEDYIVQQTREIAAKMEKGLVKDQLHELRKRVKEVIYLNKLLGKPEGHSSMIGDAGKMDQLQELIGQWHDLKKFEGKIRELKNVRPVKRVMDSIYLEEKRLLNDIFKFPRFTIEEPAEGVSA